jgi:imidazolonepropionase
MSSKTYFNIKELLTLEGVVEKDGRHVERDDLGILQNAYIVVRDGSVVKTGTGKPPKSDKNINLKGAVVLPAFVDSHTHVTYSGSRSNEFEMRSEGKSYQEIANAGGGIISTVNATRKSSVNELYKNTITNIERLKKFGVGVVEAKSGYGLDMETEIRQLEAIAKAKKDNPYIVPTLLAAHDIPPGTNDKEKRKSEYIEIIVKKLMPKVAEKKLAMFCDVFLDDGYYTVDETRYILNEGKRYGFVPKIHADEFTNQEGAALAVELGAASADHLLCISKKGIEALSGSNTVATILPGTSFNLGLQYAPAKKLIEAGACLAIASDFNPGSNAGLNFQLMLYLAVTQCKVSIAQSIAAGCYGGAKAIKMEKEFGHLTKGAKALFQAYNIEKYQDIFYNYGENSLNSIFVP